MNAQIIRPYKWSSWDCEIWEKNGKKIYAFGEQKWADIQITGNYNLVPLQQHSEFTWVDTDNFCLHSEDETDLLFVIDGDSCTYEASDVYESIDFRGLIELETEYNEAVKKFEEENDYQPNANEVLEELGYQSLDGYHIVKFYQRKLGE
jgi:hypothetical protein